MASSSSNPLSQVPQIPDLFSWSPPRLSQRLRPGIKTAKKTREPAFFDSHFSEKLKLLHVKRHPTLIRDLTAVVDKALAVCTQFPLSHFHSAEAIVDVVSEIEKNVVDEREVASFYERTTASFSLRVASILALGIRHLLRWSQLGNFSGYAIADGFLYFPDPTDPDSAVLYAQLEAQLGKETVDLIRLLAKDRSSLAAYEFKNLATGREEVMLAVPNLSNSPNFEWPDCIAPDFAGLPKHDDERRKAEEMERRMGHDAKSPPWTLDHVRGSSEIRKRKRDDDCNTQNSGLRRSSRETLQRSMPPPPPPVGGVGVGVGAAFPSVKRKEKEVAKGTGEVQSEHDDVCDLSYTDANDLSALFIVQQAWAQATRANCSIIVVQSGNYEFIGIRHRATQTLYISDIIKPHACTEPSYGKLHVGVYVAAVEDAIDRAKQDAAGSGDDPYGGGPSDGMDSKDEGGSKGPRGGGKGGKKGSKKKGGKKDSKPTEGNTGSDSTAMRTLEFASCRDVILVYLQYGVYDSPSPSTFVRSGPNGQAPVPLPSRETIRKYRLEECLTIVLKSEIGDGQTGKVLRGTLMVEASACLMLDIALKLALGSERGNALRNEYRMYRLLGKSGVTGGITTSLGLFDDVQGDACALLMPYVGTPLGAMPEFVLTSSYQEAILATLKEIHKANILHGDLRLDNILVADSGHTIIDFSRSRVCCDQDAKDREYSRFQALLMQCTKQNSQKS